MIKKLEKATLIVMALFLLPLFLMGSSNDSQEFLRLHVLANSDSPRDQMLKLQARDEILTEINSLLVGITDLETALKIIGENEDKLKISAYKAINEEYEVSILLGREKYPEKVYGSYKLPEGEYLSLRVIIGKGEGKNWWCVLFPLLCSLEAGENAIEVVDTKGGPPVKFRFKIAENKKEPLPPSLDAVFAFLQQFRLWPWS